MEQMSVGSPDVEYDAKGVSFKPKAEECVVSADAPLDGQELPRSDYTTEENWGRLRGTVKRKRKTGASEYHGLKGAALEALEIPPKLRNETHISSLMTWFTKRHRKFVELVGLKGSDSSVMRDLCRHMKLIVAPPDTIIVRQGQIGRSCFVVVSGSCDVLRLRDPSNPTLVESTIYERGVSKSESTVKAGGNKMATVICKVSQIYRGQKAEIGAEVEAEMAREEGLDQKPPPNPHPHRRASGRRPSMMAANPGSVSTKTGERLEDLLSGRSHKVSDRRILGELLATKEEGDVFGELALIRSDSKRAATVVANGRYSTPQGLLSMNDLSEEPDETIVVEIPHEVFDACLSISNDVGLPKKLRHLNRMHIFRHMIDTDKITMCYNLLAEHYPARQCIFRTGQRSTHVFFVHKGKVALRRKARIAVGSAADAPQTRDQGLDLEIVTALSTFGMLEVVNQSETYFSDAIAVCDSVVLALPRELFEPAVYPTSKDPVVLDLAKDIKRNAHRRQDWRLQRAMMQHPIRISAAMQVGAIPCARCGTLKHVTTSLECPAQNQKEQLYDTMGRRNSGITARRRSTVSSVLGSLEILNIAKKLDEEELLASTALEKAKAATRARHVGFLKDELSSLGDFPSLTQAAKRCQKIWANTKVVSESEAVEPLELFGGAPSPSPSSAASSPPPSPTSPCASSPSMATPSVPSSFVPSSTPIAAAPRGYSRGKPSTPAQLPFTPLRVPNSSTPSMSPSSPQVRRQGGRSGSENTSSRKRAEAASVRLEKLLGSVDVGFIHGQRRPVVKLYTPGSEPRRASISRPRARAPLDGSQTERLRREPVFLPAKHDVKKLDAKARALVPEPVRYDLIQSRMGPAIRRKEKTRTGGGRRARTMSMFDATADAVAGEIGVKIGDGLAPVPSDGRPRRMSSPERLSHPRKASSLSPRTPHRPLEPPSFTKSPRPPRAGCFTAVEPSTEG